jgi:murein DD-endopeptidase MepM/ murein hydrolase activator NlpD
VVSVRRTREIVAFLAGLCVLPLLSLRPLPPVEVERVAGGAVREVVPDAPGSDARIAAQVKALERALARQDSAWMRRTPRGVPVPGAVLTSGVSASRFHPILRVSRPHRGVDLAAPEGTAVFATADGVVSYTFRNRSYGVGLDVDHGHGTYTRYAHLSAVLVRAGERVRRGMLLGRVGQTGLATGPHLHYEVFIAFRRIDPVATFGAGLRVAVEGGAGD